MNENDIKKILVEFGERLIKSQEPTPPEFEKMFQENFWELIA